MRKIFFLIVAAIAAFMWGDFSLAKITELEFLSGKKNIVVMGCDIRKDDAGRSDTLFVVMMDKSDKKAALLSVPRDTRVKIKGHGWDKINSAFAYGGHKLTQETVQNFLGIKLHNYVVVDFQGFKGLVDAVGGVDINVEKRMYYYDPYANFEIDLRPGNQHMDGKTAMQYVRYRDEEGDIGRIRRQQIQTDCIEEYPGQNARCFQTDHVHDQDRSVLKRNGRAGQSDARYDGNGRAENGHGAGNSEIRRWHQLLDS